MSVYIRNEHYFCVWFYFSLKENDFQLKKIEPLEDAKLDTPNEKHRTSKIVGSLCNKVYRKLFQRGKRMKIEEKKEKQKLGFYTYIRYQRALGILDCGKLHSQVFGVHMNCYLLCAVQ